MRAWIRAAILVMALSLFWTMPRCAEAEVLTEDDVRLALKENAVKEKIRSCLGQDSDLVSVEVALEVGPDGKTKFVSLQPDMPKEPLACVKHAFEEIVFEPVDNDYEIKCVMNIKAPAEKSPQPETPSHADEYKKLKRRSAGMIASGILLASAGGVMFLCGFIFSITALQDFLVIGEPESNKLYRESSLAPALSISGVIIFFGGVGLSIAGFVLDYRIRKNKKTAFLPSPGLHFGPSLSEAALSLAWTF